MCVFKKKTTVVCCKEMIKVSVMALIAIFIQNNRPNQCESWCAEHGWSSLSASPWQPAPRAVSQVTLGYLAMASLLFFPWPFFPWPFESFRTGNWYADYSMLYPWDLGDFRNLCTWVFFLRRVDGFHLSVEMTGDRKDSTVCPFIRTILQEKSLQPF